MAVIDIGAAAIDRPDSVSGTFTTLAFDNPANASGKITSVEIWAYSDMSGVRVGTFYLISDTTYKCRDSVVIGNVTPGSKQTFGGLSIAVEAGDLIGAFWTTGSIERDVSGCAGWYDISGDYTNPGDEGRYVFSTGDAISLYGIGTTGVTHELAGIIVGVASVSGIALIIRTLAGITSGVASASGLALVAYRLAGIAEGAASVTGLARITRSLSGLSSGVSSITASLKTIISLSGAVMGTAIVTGLLFPIKLVTRILHVRHPALLSVIHRRGEKIIREYHDLSSLDDQYLTKQVGLDVAKGDTIEATTIAGIGYRHQV